VKKLIAVGVAAVLVASGVSAAAPAAAEAWSYRSCGITDYSHWTYDRGSISERVRPPGRVGCPAARRATSPPTLLAGVHGTRPTIAAPNTGVVRGTATPALLASRATGRSARRPTVAGSRPLAVPERRYIG
jgi:hypothetical protein